MIITIIKMLMLITMIIIKIIIVIIIVMIMVIEITTRKGSISLHNCLAVFFGTNSENLVAQTHISDKINEYQFILKHVI